MRGVIISPPIQCAAEGFVCKNHTIDPSLLRLWLLFWDRLDYPANRVIRLEANLPELEQAGILTRTLVNFGSGTPSPFLDAARLTFNMKETEDPGAWSIAQGTGTLEFAGEMKDHGRGLIFTLANSILVPDVSVPLDRVLEFRDQHKPERDALIGLIEDLYLDVRKAEDEPLAERRAFERLQGGLTDHIQACRATKGMEFVMADLSANFGSSVIGGLVSMTTTLISGLTLPVSLGVGAAAMGSSLSIGAAVRWTGAKQDRNSPYGYVGLIKNRLEWHFQSGLTIFPMGPSKGDQPVRLG